MSTTPPSPLDSSLSDPDSRHPQHARALVLGGGGSAGNAWLIGVIAGLLEAGLDVTDADLIIGTSAGATAAAQITGAAPAELLADILSAVPQQRAGGAAPAGAAPGGARTSAGSVSDHLARFQRTIADAEDAADMRRTMGAMALEADAASDGSGQERWRSIVASRLPGRHWPLRDVFITAVDAQTGEPVVFDRHSGVDLVDAVAASTSGGGSAYGIGGRGYIDGGYRRSSENADLALGSGRVLVLSPLSGRSLYPPEWGMQLSVQVDELREGGSRVETVLPDVDSLAAFGGNLMDPRTRMPAARAGSEQGRALAERLSAFWRG
ncbi:patatin-like phospholipase family protein [Leifsonia sp. YIM 134122]|uniref:Patatin-like phospholipase family protein n=1 Tax=Leifsonia stereocauli TaxID=3134136 RepID=A0ABU9W4Z4_9MICO